MHVGDLFSKVAQGEDEKAGTKVESPSQLEVTPPSDAVSDRGIHSEDTTASSLSPHLAALTAAVDSQGASTPLPLPLASQPMPGERYRATSAYRCLNLSLVTELGRTNSGSEGVGTVALGRSISFRSVPSSSMSNLLLSVPLMYSSSASTIMGLGIPLFEANGSSPAGYLARTQRLLVFVHSHRGILNLLIRSDPTLLEGSFASLIRITQLRSYLLFDSKRNYFFARLHRMRPERGRNRTINLQLRRGQVRTSYSLQYFLLYLASNA